MGRDSLPFCQEPVVKNHLIIAAAAAGLLVAVPVFAQTATDAAQQKAQSLSHGDVAKQPAQSLAHGDAAKQAAQGYSHADPNAGTNSMKQH